MHKRRRHKRVPISASVGIAYEDREKGGTFRAMAADISLSGIGLYSDSPLEPETEVSLTVNFISRDGGISSATLKGNIIYVKDIGDMHFMGVEFNEELNKAAQPLLYEHIMESLISD
jgi:c-di-GMP-binding flagellar brake protein YcgR